MGSQLERIDPACRNISTLTLQLETTENKVSAQHFHSDSSARKNRLKTRLALHKASLKYSIMAPEPLHVRVYMYMCTREMLSPTLAGPKQPMQRAATAWRMLLGSTQDTSGVSSPSSRPRQSSSFDMGRKAWASKADQELGCQLCQQGNPGESICVFSQGSQCTISRAQSVLVGQAASFVLCLGVRSRATACKI